MKIGMKKLVDVDVTTVDLFMKVRDECAFALKDSDGETVLEYEGYVPHVLIPGEYGDYMHLVIDVDTGQIKNWKKPTPSELASFVEEVGASKD